MGVLNPVVQEINQYLKYLNAHQQKVVLSVVKIFAQAESDWRDGVEDAARKSVERGLKDADMGKVTPHKEVMTKYKKWLSK